VTDNDFVEKSNLNRQFLFRSHHIQVGVAGDQVGVAGDQVGGAGDQVGVAGDQVGGAGDRKRTKPFIVRASSAVRIFLFYFERWCVSADDSDRASL